MVARAVCPAYAKIAKKPVHFNSRIGSKRFVIQTSNKNNTTPRQHFVLCRGTDEYGDIHDDFTPGDVPKALKVFPSSRHSRQPITVAQFVRIY